MPSLIDSPAPADFLPPVLAGPLLRRTEPGRLVFWLVGSRPLTLSLVLASEAHQLQRSIRLDGPACQRLAIGRDAVLHLIDVVLDEALPSDCLIEYDLRVHAGAAEQGIADWAPHLLYEGARRPSFVIKSRLDRVLHGSCRKPHHAAADGLLCVDQLLAREHSDPLGRPALLLMTGDQVYADDVAGPMLVAIHALVRRLGLYGERLEGAVVDDSDALFAHPATYYRREQLLPAFKSNEALRERFFGGVEKPVFTTANGQNHLITLGEVMAMYLLVWSPLPWTLIAPAIPMLEPRHAERYRCEDACLQAFRQGLPQVARALAHVPSLMIFDDHDITDDWNLSARWEETAYGHPLSRRIIGNALIAYLLCQAWGNQPERFGELLVQTRQLLDTAGAAWLDCAAQDRLIDDLFKLDGWGYELATEPPLVVLDTRTRRWRSERNLSRPSGLMDWEALSEFQQHILDKPSVLIVSPPPMFGVKLIETVQRAFSWAGQPLLVDAENWMAHRGAAHVMMNIFRHSRTPGDYVILSGDVHYSFVYEVHIRARERGPRVWQITSSGVKNEFPRRLLDWFDRLNRWLYAPWSPLNWLTKRRRLEVVPRVPDRSRAGERLWNGAGIGLLVLDEHGRPQEIYQLNADGSGPVAFLAERPA
ncbi:alkaline phosphatase family protein [Pseudomonas lopnurensis]|uniref:alkaline phosphatase family protein n=1 Tax=Pseudomonas lopnurensis TaxID=1477517 RepID=UPI0028A64430|nr:alkaline phosphatase family protein [Pseudomonas lopnurensis]